MNLVQELDKNAQNETMENLNHKVDFPDNMNARIDIIASPENDKVLLTDDTITETVEVLENHDGANVRRLGEDVRDGQQ